MYRLVEYNNVLRADWDAFAMKCGTLFHTVGWKEILEETFGYQGLYYAVTDEKGDMQGILPLVACRNMSMKKVGVSLPFINYLDVCCKNDEVYGFIANELKGIRISNKLDYIELRLKDGDIVNNTAADINDSNYIFMLPLDGGEDAVFSLLSGSNRNHVRKASKSGAFSVSFDKSRLKDFNRVYCMNMKRLGSPAPDISFYRSILEKFPSETAMMTVIDNETGYVAGGMFFVIHKDVIHYLWGSSLASYNRKYINNFMYWEAIRFGIKTGCRYFDFGRSPVDSGTYKFKLQWGGKPVQLKYCRFSEKSKDGRVSDREKYKPLVSLWKVMPDFLTDAVGKRIIKYVIP